MSTFSGDPALMLALATAAGPRSAELQLAGARLTAAIAGWNSSAPAGHQVGDPVSAELRRLGHTVADLDRWVGEVGDALVSADTMAGRRNLWRTLHGLLDDAPTAALDDLVASLIGQLETSGTLTPADLLGLEVDDLSAAGQRPELPLEARDLVNRTAIGLWLADQPSTEGAQWSDATGLAESEWDRLVMLRALLGRDPAPTPELHDLLTGQPLAVLRFVPSEGPDREPTLQLFRGDPATIEHTVVWVPGTTHGVHTMEENLQVAETIRHQAANLATGAASVGVVIDLYDAPNEILLGRSNAARTDYAKEHAAALQQAAGDARSFADGGNVTMIGHSYGSFAAGTAAAAGVDVDDLVLIGSPGTGAGHADDFELAPGGEVHVARAPKDQIDIVADLDEEIWPGATGFALGPDPADADFGAQAFEVNSPEAAPGEARYASGHSGYLQPGSQSVYNMATIAVGGEPTRALLSDADDRLVEVDAPGPSWIDDDVARSRPEYYGGTDVTRAVED